MTRIEFFENGFARLGVENGVISTSVFMKFIHYKVFLDYLAEGHDKSTSIQLTADRLKTSFSTVWRSVHYFTCE